MFKGYLEKRVS